MSGVLEVTQRNGGWIHLLQVAGQYRALMNKLMNFRGTS